MITEHFYKAQGYGDEEEVDSVSLVLDTLTPTCSTLLAQRLMFNIHAKRFVGWLIKYAPGGLVDQILIEMLKEKASLFVVPHR